MSKKIDYTWLYNYGRLKEFVEKYNRLPEIGECEASLYKWLDNLIRGYNLLPQNKKKLLSEINFTVLLRAEPDWEYMYNRVKKFIILRNRFPDREQDRNNLVKWMREQRILYRTNKLDDKRIDLLNQLGDWYREPIYEKWKEYYDMLMKFVEEKGRLPVTKDNGPLVSWIQHQQKKYNKGKLSEDRLEQLNTLNTVLIDMHDYIWEEKYPELLRFIEINNRLPIKEDNQDELLEWIQHIKWENLTDEQINKLEQLPCWRWKYNNKRKRYT